MEILDELMSIDKKLQDDLETRRIDAEKAKRGIIKAEEERKKDERDARKKRKIEEIQRAVEDTGEGLDDPHIYIIEYSHTQGGGYGYGEFIGPGTRECEVLMSEREKRIAQLTGLIKKCTNAHSLAYGCECTDVISVTPSSRELSEVEKMKCGAIEQKVSIIKNNEEAKNDCVLNLYDDEFGSIQIHTSLQNALLSSLSIANGNIKEEKARKAEEEKRNQEEERKAEEAETQESIQHNTAYPIKTEQSRQKDKGFTLRGIQQAISKFLGRGER